MAALWMFEPQFKKFTICGNREVESEQNNKEEKWGQLENILLQEHNV